MNKHLQIINIISAIRDLHPKMVEICTFGSCLKFHYVLRRIFPESEPLFNIDHVITKIDNNYYDITGEINKKEVENKGFKPFSEFYSKKRISRAFTQMQKSNKIIV